MGSIWNEHTGTRARYALRERLGWNEVTALQKYLYFIRAISLFVSLEWICGNNDPIFTHFWILKFYFCAFVSR